MAHILYGTSKRNIFNHDRNLQFQHNDPFLHHNKNDRARDPISTFRMHSLIYRSLMKR